MEVVSPGLVRWRKPLDVVSHVSDWLLLLLLLVHLVLHWLEVEGDGLVLPLDGVRVHLDNLQCFMGNFNTFSTKPSIIDYEDLSHFGNFTTASYFLLL